MASPDVHNSVPLNFANLESYNAYVSPPNNTIKMPATLRAFCLSIAISIVILSLADIVNVEYNNEKYNPIHINVFIIIVPPVHCLLLI